MLSSFLDRSLQYATCQSLNSLAATYCFHILQLLELFFREPLTIYFLQITFTVDRTPPDITGCPTIVREVVELGTTGAIAMWTEPTASDISGQVTLEATVRSPSFFPVGVTEVVYTFRDSSGNEATCSFMVRVDTGELLIIKLFVFLSFGAV